MSYQLQILHASDLEGGVEAIDRAANFAAIVDVLEDQYANSLTLSAGDNVIPGPFFNASSFVDGSVYNSTYNTLFGLSGDAAYTGLRAAGGRTDISIMNVIGFDASALGNHEFDNGVDVLEDIIETDFRGDAGVSTDRWVGTNFPYLSANLTFENTSLSDFATTDILTSSQLVYGPTESIADTPNSRIAPAVILNENGENIGVIGLTTPLLGTISSPGSTTINGPTSNDIDALAAVLQPTVNAVIAQGVNKVILVSHLQQFSLEAELASKLSGVDVIIAGGSDTLLADGTDTLRSGDTAAQNYPFTTTDLNGNPTLVVSTDGQYSYVGRLVLTFDDNGIIDTSSLDENVNGSYATTSDVVSGLANGQDLFAAGTKGGEVQTLVTAVQGIVTAQDGNISGNTNVFLEGRREQVRTEETNFGNLTADANLAIAQSFDATVQVSIKNGGGIRAAIGEVAGTSENPVYANPQANSAVGKNTGDVSQLDITNSLRFNNELVLQTVNHQQLVEILEHAVASSGEGQTPGQFAQVAGVRFSYDTSREANSRVQNAAIVDDETGVVIAPLMVNGVFVGDESATVRLVTLNFLQGGGDGYPFQTQAEALGATAANVVNLTSALSDAGRSTFANPGTEQDALAEYLLANFGSGTSFNDAETSSLLDLRIQHLNIRADDVFSRTNNSGFDEQMYLDSNADVATQILNGVFASGQEHFNAFGAKEGRDPNAFFDTSYYLAQNADVAAAGVNAWEHYLAYGASEGRDPSQFFDTSDYVAANSDVAASDLNPLVHLLSHGLTEGRYTTDIMSV